MNTPIPTRITIELERAATRQGGWRARTSVGGSRNRRSRAQEPFTPVDVMASQQSGTPWTPAPYEPGPCTCEGGLCDRDHENE